MDPSASSAASGRGGVDPSPAAFRAAPVDCVPTLCAPSFAVARPQGGLPRVAPPGPQSAVACPVSPQVAAVSAPADAPKAALGAPLPRPRQPHRVTFDTAVPPVPFFYTAAPTPPPPPPPEPSYGYSTMLLSESAIFSVLGGTSALTDRKQGRSIAKDVLQLLLVSLSMLLMLTAALVLVVSVREKKSGDEDNGDIATTTVGEVTTTLTEAAQTTPTAQPLLADNADEVTPEYIVNHE